MNTKTTFKTTKLNEMRKIEAVAAAEGDVVNDQDPVRVLEVTIVQVEVEVDLEAEIEEEAAVEVEVEEKVEVKVGAEVEEVIVEIKAGVEVGVETIGDRGVKIVRELIARQGIIEAEAIQEVLEVGLEVRAKARITPS